MPSIAVFIALLGLSAAATMRTMNGKPLGKDINDGELTQDPLPPTTSFEDILATGKTGEKDAEVMDKMKTNAERMIEEQKAEEVHEDHPEKATVVLADEGLEHPVESHENDEMNMAVPEMFVEGSPESTFQNGLTPKEGKPSNTEHENGNGSGQSHPGATPNNGNSKRGGSFSSSAASAASFSKGPNSHASSQAQAFSFGK